MAMRWTEDQKKVISLRDRNILVSAAAGSGKTAVLVQRILGKVMDPDHPVDIDRLLIMTFTRAAAGEMRERISRALEEALSQDPDNEHLQRQTTLIHTAQITTIDGFCSYIIRSYFHMIGLDPGYRTVDEGELKLLKEDVFQELMEELYGQGQPEFLEFVECYAPGKTDEGIKDLVLKLYEVAMSSPYPEEWLEECLDPYQISSKEEMKEQKWLKLLWEAAREDLEEAEEMERDAIRICREPYGPFLYEEALLKDLQMFEQLREAFQEEDYDGCAQLFSQLTFARLSSKKADREVDERKKAGVKSLRDGVKKLVKDLRERYFSSSQEEILRILQACKSPAAMLCQMTKAFMTRFGEKKREKNLLDFTDMEHFALDILMKKEGDTYRMSQAAKELSARYEEVLVDEYQDSNLVQEMITTCVSGWVNQRKNVFMVGDVKQSIYRFRLARPELFMEKYRTYSLKDSQEQRVDLHKNFRSRPQVLKSVNYLFRRIMGEDLGGIAYGPESALYPGAVFPEGGDPEFPVTELLLLERRQGEGEEILTPQEAREAEALAVAKKIRELEGKALVLDKETGEYRKAGYGDMVILLRTSSGWAETFGEVLTSQGIPYYTASKTGYFSALEVVTVLNYLRICDNPLQDIPAAGVLRSPMVGCTSQELAVLRSRFPEGKLYESIESYIMDFEEGRQQSEEDRRLYEKLKEFVSLLEEFRDMAAYTPVHKMITAILERTGYGSYASAMPGGEQRRANLDMLVEKAMDYEKTSYRGLFHFVRYIQQLQKYQVDYGQVNLTGAEGFVQIMTIHKSKGLEFPIVFVSGMGKSFNFQDLNARLLIHPDLGLGADAILPQKRVIAASLQKQVIRRQLLKETLGEELRVLYVALTRAKEKLIMTGAVASLESQVMEASRFSRGEGLLPVGRRMRSGSFLDYILPALAGHEAMNTLYRSFGMETVSQTGKNEEEWVRGADFRIQRIQISDLVQREVLDQAEEACHREVLLEWDPDRVYDEAVRREIEERFGYLYPYGYLNILPVKLSVSELKKRDWKDDQEKEEAVYFEPDVVPLIPRFMQEAEEGAITGAGRGTAYHRVMECLKYEKTDSIQEVEAQLRELVELKKLAQEEADCIRMEDIWHFLGSSLGQRMKKASREGRLCREQPFVISRPAKELDPAWDWEEPVLVQGIIDAYFYEGEELVLVDYKTDRIGKGEEQRLVNLYHIQLEDYAQALERMTGKKVKEKIIYSFGIGREIMLDA